MPFSHPSLGLSVFFLSFFAVKGKPGTRGQPSETRVYFTALSLRTRTPPRGQGSLARSPIPIIRPAGCASQLPGPGCEVDDCTPSAPRPTRDGTRTGSPPARAGFWKDDQGDRWGSPAPDKGHDRLAARCAVDSHIHWRSHLSLATCLQLVAGSLSYHRHTDTGVAGAAAGVRVVRFDRARYKGCPKGSARKAPASQTRYH